MVDDQRDGSTSSPVCGEGIGVPSGDCWEPSDHEEESVCVDRGGLGRRGSRPLIQDGGSVTEQRLEVMAPETQKQFWRRVPRNRLIR